MTEFKSITASNGIEVEYYFANEIGPGEDVAISIHGIDPRTFGTWEAWSEWSEEVFTSAGADMEAWLASRGIPADEVEGIVEAIDEFMYLED